ncbi:MAG: type II secretion system protein [Desulfuromonadaceae bacterium]|nr:type II secretion system protein [Desulfuromonadaceae bacterium]MDD2855782.1 type II secretion system protein [Desulfuromonadaceae bacterium]
MIIIRNQNGFTYILALTIVIIMGIMLGMVGQSWKTIKQREREKELLFRGSQIKEAIENWYNPKYTVPGIPAKARHPLMDLKDLLQDPYSLSKLKFIPHNYAAELDDTDPKCAPDCPKIKIYQDPMTGKEWTVIRGAYDQTKGAVPAPAGTQSGGIIGVASKSKEKPFRTDFKNTALEKIISLVSATVPETPVVKNALPAIAEPGVSLAVTDKETSSADANKGTYSEWQFIADKDNDHTKLYRAYHEGW